VIQSAPHVIPYQGSKRKLADAILSLVDFDVETLYEPFVGSGAITLAAAANQMAQQFVVADKLEPLIALWHLLVTRPNEVVDQYASLWRQQLSDPAAFFRVVRDDYNRTQDPVKLLYLVARCVKNAVRFNGRGEFNQGPDNRRLGLRPEKLAREAGLLAKLLQGRITMLAGDFRATIANAGPRDLIYMDPPWQGTSGRRDPRYAYLLDLDELIAELDRLNGRGVPYMLSFDGACGDKQYGQQLPEFLGLHRMALNAGRSSQATLLGRQEVTIESLYLSPAFVEKKCAPMPLIESPQRELFEMV
jgi:DNA adenine methylase